MDITSIFSRRGEDKSESYWAIVIKPGWVDCGIWRITAGTAQVVANSGPVSWEDGTNALLEALDSSLTIASQNFKEESGEPKRAVFGVVTSWVSEGKIKSEYLEQLRHICSRLEIEPAGFVVLPEAIAHYIHTEEGTPVNAVLIGVDEQEISVSLFRLGAFTGTSIVARSVSIVEDVEEGLSRFPKDEPFPSRFVLFDSRGAELEDLKQSLIASDWKSENVKFLHTPKVEALSAQFLVSAVALAGAAEIGKERIKEADVTATTVPLSQEAEVVQEAQFTQRAQEDLPDEKVPETAPAADFGFEIDSDIKKHIPDTQALPSRAEIQKEDKDSQVPLKTRKVLSFPTPNLSEASIVLLKNMGRFLSRGRNRAFGLLIFFLATLFIAGAVMWLYLPKAQITLYISPHKIEKELEVIIDPSAQMVDHGSKTLPGSIVEIEVSGEKSKESSGTKLVGERAKGTVKFFNTGESLAISSATVLSGPGALKFTVAEAVQVASGSAAIRGEGKATVTAADIGTQYNLAAGSTFVVGNFPTSRVEGTNETAFSGGSSQEVVVVSKEDQDDLESSLKDELERSGVLDLKTKIPTNQLLLEGFATTEVLTRNFSADVEEETQSLGLSLKLKTKTLVVEREKFFEFLKSELEGSIPEGFVLREEQVDSSFDRGLAGQGGRFNLKVRVVANLLPDVKVEEIAQSIKGKYPSVAREYLTTIAGFNRAEIILKPKLPAFLSTLPRSSKRISIEIAAER